MVSYGLIAGLIAAITMFTIQKSISGDYHEMQYPDSVKESKQ